MQVSWFSVNFFFSGLLKKNYGKINFEIHLRVGV